MSPSKRHRRPVLLMVLAALVIGSSGIDYAPPPDNPAVAPAPRTGRWLKQHEAFVERASQGNVDLLFLGDSITALWDKTAPTVWERYYAPRHPANFGIGGDHTQHLLWRLDHDEIEGIKPRVVVLMVGTNNIPHETENQIFEGVKAVVDRVRAKLPESKILLLGVLPRGLDHNPSQVTTAPDPRVAPLNARLSKLDNGQTLRYLDIGPALLNPSGQLVQVIQPDFLHLSRKGYQIWADAMEPRLWEMMEAR